MSKSNMKELKTNKILNTSNFETSDCSVGVIHIGVGNFHRAHQALYFNKILNDKNSSNWGIAGINLRSQDRKHIEDLNKSENQYILKTVSAGGEVIYEEIKSILALYDWKDSEDKIQKLFTSNNVQLITITVTESGYYFDKNDNLKLFTKDIKSDLSGKVPVTVFGALARGLKARMDTNGKPITVASCDNIQENGIMLKKCFFQFLHALNDEKLLKWVKKNVSFPSSMVDRITPKISKNELNKIQETFNRSEDCSVISEDFIQWVIEDNFAGKKPPLDLVGVEIVEDVEPYENTKIKILNGGHIALAYLGVLYGYKTYDAAIRDEELSVFFDSIQSKEIIPSLPNKSPINYKEYLTTTKNRFQNQHLPDSLSRICMDGVSKFPIFLMPVIEWHFSRGLIPSLCLKAIASWYVFLCHVFYDKIEFEYVEPKWSMLTPFLVEDGEIGFASDAELWGEIPGKYPDFIECLFKEIQALKERFG